MRHCCDCTIASFTCAVQSKFEGLSLFDHLQTLPNLRQQLRDFQIQKQQELQEQGKCQRSASALGPDFTLGNVRNHMIPSGRRFDSIDDLKAFVKIPSGKFATSAMLTNVFLSLTILCPIDVVASSIPIRKILQVVLPQACTPSHP